MRWIWLAGTNGLYLYSLDLHPFPVVNEESALKLGCQKADDPHINGLEWVSVLEGFRSPAVYVRQLYNLLFTVIDKCSHTVTISTLAISTLVAHPANKCKQYIYIIYKNI